MTPTTSTHGPESDDGRQDAPGATDTATEAREAINLDAIEARAKAATDGPWEILPHSHIEKGCRCLSCYGETTVWQLTNFIECEDVPQFDRDAHRCEQSGLAEFADAAHIAGMDPATTLALVRELREARAEVERWKRVADGCERMTTVAEAERDDLRARLAKVENVRQMYEHEAGNDAYTAKTRQLCAGVVEHLSAALGGDR